MPETEIERTIYKLELDGSAYVDGVEKTANATKKLSEAQEAANKKLAQLTAQQAAYVKELEEVTGAIKANEAEVLNLNKRNNELKDRSNEITARLKQLKAEFKGNSDEAKKLQKELTGINKESKTLQSTLRGIATNTKEFRIEQAALKNNLSATNTSLKAHTAEMKAAEAASGNFTKGISKAYGGLRVLANLIPGIGIGGLVSLIAGPLVNAIGDWFQSLEKVNNETELLKLNQSNVAEVMESADKAAGKQVTDLKILYQAATDVNLSIGERKKAVEALQREFPDYFGNIKTETILNGQAETQYDLLTQAILRTARATAAKAKLDELEAQQLDLAFQKQKAIDDANKQLNKKAEAGTSQGAGLGGRTVVVAPELNKRILDQQAKVARDATLAQIAQNQKLLQAQEDFLIKFAGLTDLAHVVEDADAKKFKDKKEKQTKEIVNIYEQELQKLKADIAKLDEKGFTDEASITASIEADFKIRSDAFVKAFKNKQLTAPQLASLQQNLKNLQDLTLNAQLKSFREQRQAYLQAINDEISNLQIEESTKRIATIQNNFERERQTIIAETDKTISALEQKRDQRIAQILKDAAKNGLKPEDVAPQIQEIKNIYGKLLNDLPIIKNQKLQQLAFETFEALSEDAKRTLDAENLGISEGSLFRIKQQAELFQQGKISFKEYQKSLTEIARNEANERFNVEKAFLQAEIKIRQDKLALDKTLTDDQIKRLQDEIRALQKQLVDAEKGNITGNTKDPKDKTKLQKFQEYATAVGSLTQSIISFWQKSNEAEQKALDRSISLQEKRVDAAQRIADRGNAQYLKAEQDRLNELNVQRENAARKQLGIDAALQASQILVGITGAIAKIATPGIGAAETISEIAVIIGALATGFGLVKSLQGNQPKLYEGTKYLQLDGSPAGRDTIPVMANEGEAVIPTETNKEYHPAVSAIYDRTIPAEDLNHFVNTYHKIKPIPQLNYERIGEVAVLRMEHDGRMSVLLTENNKKLDEHIELQKLTIKHLKNIGVNVNLDKNGFAVTQMEVMEKIKRDKKV